MRVLILVLLFLVSACGGGDPEEGDRAFIGPPNCEARPLLCG